MKCYKSYHYRPSDALTVLLIVTDKYMPDSVTTRTTQPTTETPGNLDRIDNVAITLYFQ